MSGAPREAYISLADLAAIGIAPPVFSPPRPTITYVVKRQRWVKIGKTAVGVEQRLATLRLPRSGVRCPLGMDVTAPLELLFTIGRDVEAVLHERYAAHRVAGEWFVADQVMVSELAELAERSVA
jgi:hypothetical protein